MLLAQQRENPRAYVVVVIAIAIGLVAAVLSLNFVAFYFGLVKLGVVELFEYQRAKLRNSPPPQTILIGDSSLGNSIDAAMFSKLSGKPALNLALTGGHGYGGSYNMLRGALKHFPNITNVVIFQTATMPTRSVNLIPYYQTQPESESGVVSAIDQKLQYTLFLLEFGTLQYVIAKLRQDQPGPGIEIEDDYIKQGSRVTVSESAHLEGTINPDQMRFLQMILQTCRNKNLNCLYAIGPLHETLCRTSRNFIEMVRDAVTNAGATIIGGTPVCIANSEIGDSDDHVGPAFKNKYTRMYFELMFSKLKGSH